MCFWWELPSWLQARQSYTLKFPYSLLIVAGIW